MHPTEPGSNLKFYCNEHTFNAEIEGKALFVDEKLKPLLCSINCGWKDVKYSADIFGNEYVELINSNPDKTVKVNISMGSLYALVCDVMKHII